MIKAPALAGHEIPTVPFPPNTGSMDPTYQLIFTIVLCAVCAGFILFALNSLRKTGSPLALLMLAGGALCVFIEPIVDVMGLCWFWRDGNWSMIELFGRPIPVWMLPTYTFFVGGQTFYAYKRFDRGDSMKGVWALYAIYALVDVFLEEPPLHFGLYSYYGSAEPLQPSMLPLWWPAVNAAMPMAAAALIYRLRPVLTGWKQLLVIPIIPMADGAANAAAGWPVWNALNSSESALVTNAAALLTVLLCCLLNWIVALSVASDSALRAVSGARSTGRTTGSAGKAGAPAL